MKHVAFSAFLDDDHFLTISDHGIELSSYTTHESYNLSWNELIDLIKQHQGINK